MGYGRQAILGRVPDVDQAVSGQSVREKEPSLGFALETDEYSDTPGLAEWSTTA